MKKTILGILILLSLPVGILAQLNTQQGGTGTTTPSGILYGDSTLHLKSLIVGSGLSFSGTTLSTTGGGTGTVTSVGLSDVNSTLTIGSTPVTTSGTITATLNLAHANAWTGLQTFGNTGTTTFAGGINLTTGGCFAIGGTCISGGGGGGAVSSVSNADGTLTISPTTGSVVSSINLAHANTWTAATTTFSTDAVIGRYLQVGPTPAYANLSEYIADFTARTGQHGFASLDVTQQNSGTCDTGDVAIGNDAATVFAGFTDIGVTSNAYNGTGCGPNDIPQPGVLYNSSYIFNPNGPEMTFELASTSVSNTFFDWKAGGYANSNKIMTLLGNGNLGIGTTSPYDLLSIGNTNGIGFSTATSTFNTTGGINLTSGCFAIGGNCIGAGGGGGSGTVNSGTAGDNAFYSTSGTAVSPTSDVFINPSGFVGIGGQVTTLPSLLTLAPSGTASTTASGGINFGDSAANLYRSAASTIKTDGSLNVGATTINTTGTVGADTIRAGVSGTNNLALDSALTASNNQIGVNIANTGTLVPTSGSTIHTLIGATFSPTSGSANYVGLDQGDTINQTGGASGITRGINISPAITKVIDYRALEVAGYTLTESATATTTLNSVALNPFTVAEAGASTVTNTYEENILGAPIAGANETITNSIGLNIASNDVSNGGTVTNAIGLKIFAPTGATNNLAFATASSTASGSNNPTFQIDNVGHVTTSGGTPTVTGGTSSVSGNDSNGEITVIGTALTSVTLNFTNTWATAPDCTESDNVLTVASDVTSISTTQVVFGFGVGGVTTANLWYHCQAHQ